MNLRTNNIHRRGDIVVIKNITGPKMLVLSDSDNGEVSVMWFDINNILHNATLEIDLLTKYNSGPNYLNNVLLSEKLDKILNVLKYIPEFKIAMANGQKIQAIKIARQYCDLGLKEAKDFIELPEIANIDW